MTSVPAHLTPGEAADWLTEAGVSVSEQTVRRWAKSGRLRAITLPFGRIRIPRDALAELITPSQGAA